MNLHSTHGGATFFAIAAELGISPQAVQQLERVALKKVNKRLRVLGYTFADLLPKQPGALPEDSHEPVFLTRSDHGRRNP